MKEGRREKPQGFNCHNEGEEICAWDKKKNNETKMTWKD